MSKTNNLNVDSNGHIIIGPSAIAQRRKQQIAIVDGLPKDTDGRIIIGSRYSNSLHDTLDITNDNKSLNMKKSKKKSKRKGRKKKPKYYRDLKLKKKKSKQDEKLQDLKEECVENRKPNLPAILSRLLSVKELICVYDNKVYIFDDNQHCFMECDSQKAQILLMQLLSKKERLCVTPKDIKNAFDTILVLPELQQDLSPRINIPLVNCENGVLDLETMTLLEHSPKYGFTCCIHAKYDEDAKGPVFKKWLDEATGGDKEIKTLLQGVLGYIFSEYIFAKIAFLFYGVKDSGKSVLLNVVTRMVGENHVSHVDIQRLSEPCYAARLNNKKLNIAPDVPNTPIKDIGTFKSIVSSSDIVETKALYKNPKSQPCLCKLIFGANHFIPLGKLDLMNVDAFFRRILIVPFLYSKPREEQDLQLGQKLWGERDYIFTWAMKGLKRLAQNNFIFCKSQASQDALERYKTQYCPEQVFFERYLMLDDDTVISRDEVQKKYEKFADKHGVRVGCYDMKNFITNNYPQVNQARKRINGSKNPLAVYEGLAFVE